MWLAKRSYQKELIDGDPSFDDLKVNLNELHVINRFLGGYAISMNALHSLEQPIKGIADIGCGGGHFLLEFKKLLPNSKVMGIDLKQECVEYASELCNGKGIELIKADFKEVLQQRDIDVVHACLFFHHFKEEEIIHFLKQIKESKKHLIINELERNPLAYGGIRLLTALFSRSYLVMNDAPLSVKRGFKKKEWKNMLEQAGIQQYSIKNKWAFRHQIIIDGKV